MLTITDQKNLELLQSKSPEVFKLHLEGIACAHQWSQCEADMVQILSELYKSQIHLLLNCDSLRSYALIFWNLPENAASDLVTVAKKASALPRMIELLNQRKTTISKQRKICPVITSENQEEWLHLVCECTSRVIEKTVAGAQNKELATESARYTSSEQIELKMGLPENVFHDLEQLKNLLTTKNKKPVSLQDVVSYLAKLGLEKLDPVRKAQRAQRRKSKMNNTKQKIFVPGRTMRKINKQRRSPLSAALKHQLSLRDQHQCTATLPNGQRCTSKRFLEFHHQVHVAQGGDNTLENLVTLCHAHHKAQHFQI